MNDGKEQLVAIGAIQKKLLGKKLYEEVKNMRAKGVSEEEVKMYYSKYNDKTKSEYQKLKKENMQEDLKISSFDTIENRAQKIFRIISDMRKNGVSENEVKNQWNKYKNAGILTPEVNKRYQELKEKSQPQSQQINKKRILEETQNTPQSQTQQVERNMTWGSPEWKGFAKAAAKVAEEAGYPLPVILGQAAIETGRSPSNAPRNNWFGIKGSGNAGTQRLGTQEASNGLFYNTQSNFAAFQTPEDSVRAYIDIIGSLVPNWREYAKRGDSQGLIQAIHSAGYATNPNYVALVSNTPEFRVFAQPL